MLQAIKDLPRNVNRWFLFLFGEGSWSLRSHEKLLAMAVAEFLEPSVCECLKRQLQGRFFAERSNNKITVIRFSPAQANLSVPSAAFDDVLLYVHLTVNGKKERANVTVYRGLIFSIETKRPGRDYKSAKLEISKVEHGKPNQSFVYAIDRSEHGTDKTS